MSNCRDTDNLFKMFYSNFMLVNHSCRLTAYFMKTQSFGSRYELVKDLKVSYLFPLYVCRFPCCVKMYKDKYKDVIWYAEFSDPIYMSVTEN